MQKGNLRAKIYSKVNSQSMIGPVTNYVFICALVKWSLPGKSFIPNGLILKYVVQFKIYRIILAQRANLGSLVTVDQFNKINVVYNNSVLYTALL